MPKTIQNVSTINSKIEDITSQFSHSLLKSIKGVQSDSIQNQQTNSKNKKSVTRAKKEKPVFYYKGIKVASEWYKWMDYLTGYNLDKDERVAELWEKYHGSLTSILMEYRTEFLARPHGITVDILEECERNSYVEGLRNHLQRLFAEPITDVKFYLGLKERLGVSWQDIMDRRNRDIYIGERFKIVLQMRK